MEPLPFSFRAAGKILATLMLFPMALQGVSLHLYLLGQLLLLQKGPGREDLQKRASFTLRMLPTSGVPSKGGGCKMLSLACSWAPV